MTRRKRILADLDVQIRDHIERETEDNIARGMSPEEARNAALRKFGNVTRVKEDAREIWTALWLERLAQDVRFALRMLRKNPGFATVAVLTLALGIGANTAIFSVVNGILIDRLPYSDASRLVRVVSTIKVGNMTFSGPLSDQTVEAVRASCPALNGVAGYTATLFTMIVRSTPQKLLGANVSPELFSLLGVRPILGRPILSSDAAGSAGNVAVISYQVWKDSFGSNADVIGQSVILNAKPYTIVGVMGPTFEFPLGEKGVWLPLPASGPVSGVIARLSPGATREQAIAQLKALALRLQPSSPNRSVTAYGVVDEALGNTQTEVLILLGAVVLVLIIACINVSALLLARGAARRAEFAIREALGGSKWRICRQLFTESILLSFLGACLSLLFAPWTIRAIRRIAPPHTPRIENIRLDAHVLWFVLGISVVSALAFGLAPALRLSSSSRSSTIQRGLSLSRLGLARCASRRFHDFLVILEVALALVLVVGAALLGRSFGKLTRVDSGFRTDHLLTMNVDFTCLAHQAALLCPPIQQAVLDRVRAIPSVSAVSFSSSLPMATGLGLSGNLQVEGWSHEDGLAQGTEIAMRSISPDYFQAFGVRLLSGRTFSSSESGNSDAVVIVNESFARRYFSSGALGKHISFSKDKDGKPAWSEIVGVVGDTHDGGLARKPVIEFYAPMGQMMMGGVPQSLAVRTDADPLALFPAVRDAVWSVDKSAPLTNVRAMDQVLADSVAEPRFRTVLFGSFGALGLLLAVIGAYGVISYSAAQRSHEIGVRIALGATRLDVLRLVIGHGMLLAVTGIAIGVCGALALTRFLRSFLYDLSPYDSGTFAGVVLLLALASLAACYIPARRATRVDPVTALRSE